MCIRDRDPGAQCEYLLMLGMEKPLLDSLRVDRYRIGGCRTAIWLRAEDRDGRVHFYSDSDSLLVRGVLSILEELYQATSKPSSGTEKRAAKAVCCFG